jgi:tetratricopeptide (TPR) repeat protein
LKTAFLILTLSLPLSILTGCAGLTPDTQPTADNETVTPSQEAGKQIKEAAVTIARPVRPGKRINFGKPAPANEEALPAVELTDELLFKLLAAEIAFQRGLWQSAYVSELAAAQQTRDPRLARRAVEIALSAKQASEALNAVRLWRDLAPQSQEATQYYLGFILLGDDVEPAREILAQRIASAQPPLQPIVILQTQRLLANARNKTAAFALLEGLLAPYSGLPESHIALAQNAFLKGDQERALMEARTAYKMKSDSDVAVLTLAQIVPNKAEAFTLLTDYLTRYPKATDVRTAFARSLVEQKQYERARDQFEQLLTAHPENPTSLYALGMLDVQTNRLPQAEQYLTRYVQLLSANPDENRDASQALLVLAQLADERHDTESALKWLGQIDSGDGFVNAQIKRAQIIAKRGNLSEARRLLKNIATEGESDRVLVILADAQLLRDANQLPAALTVFEDALKLFPKNTDLLYDYAMVAEKAGNFDLMENTLMRVIELAPANYNAYNALGYSFAERNIRLTEAFTLVQKALTISPDDPFIMDSMGWVQYRLGRLVEAEQLLRRAYATRSDPEIGVHLGEVLWVKGQKEDAQKLWREANTKDPKNDTLKSTLSRLHTTL